MARSAHDEGLITVKGWVDHFKTWQKDLQKRLKAGQDVRIDLLIGAEYVEKAAKRALSADGEKLKP